MSIPTNTLRIVCPSHSPFEVHPIPASCVLRSLHQAGVRRSGMPPFWPFGKKKQPLQLDEPEPQAIVYRKDSGSAEETLADSSHRKSDDYMAAVSLFGNGDTTIKRAEEQSQFYEGIVDSSTRKPTTQENFTWVHHTDGYHYKKKSDGSFDPIPHKKNNDGTYVPYQS
jgi:hypothetical protein